MIRPPAVAGRFYPSDPGELIRQIESDAAPESRAAIEKKAALGCMVPHAGYIYSGRVAGAVYASLEIPPRCILLGPRHFPRGEPLAIMSRGSWATPLGEAEIDRAAAEELLRAFSPLREDARAHESEHSLEVQIPFLQRLGPGFRFVPVALASDRYEVLEQLGKAVAQVVRASGEAMLVIASTDMNHYEPEALTRAKDERAIARILELDARGLFDTVRAAKITMCGYGATVAMLVASKELGAREAKLVSYATSADVNGDRERVVGYAGCVIR